MWAPSDSEESAPLPNVYCWICAKGDTNLRCSKCRRRFHRTCVKNHSGTDRICVECAKDDEFESFDIKFIPKMLDYVVGEKKFDSLTKISFTSEKTTNTIDLRGMRQKKYRSVKQFEEDLKWFVHNCRSIFQQNDEIQAASEKLIGFVKDEILTSQACEECYENLCESPEISATKQCSKLHLLVWNKCGEYVYWPAKVLAVHADKNMIIIQFFGDNSTYLFPMESNNCYLYSMDNPEKKRGSRQKFYLKAIEEANEYIEHVRSKYGNFKFAEPHTGFVPENLDEHLKQMIGEQTISECNASTTEPNDVNAIANRNQKRNKMRTQKVELTPSNGLLAKKTHRRTDFDKVSVSMRKNFEQSLKKLHQVNAARRQKIGNLRNHLLKMNKEKMDLVQMNEALTAEKLALEQAHCKEKKDFESKEKVLKQWIAKLKQNETKKNMRLLPQGF